MCGRMPLVFCLMGVLTITGCASTEVTSFTDPKYQGDAYDNFVVWTNDMSLDYGTQLAASICENLESKGISCVPRTELFPPTRDWNPPEVQERLQARNITGFLEVSRSAQAADSVYLGSQTRTTVTTSGNTAQASSQSVPMRMPQRQETLHVRLIDVQTREEAWIGGAQTSGQGMANVTDSAFISSAAQDIVDSLESDGHIRP